MTRARSTPLPVVRLPRERTKTLATVIAVLAALYFGREILMPLALAVLVGFALGRPVAWVEKHWVGRPWSVGLVAGMVLMLLGVAGWLAWAQFDGVLANLPENRAAIRQKLGSLTERLAAIEAAGNALVAGPTEVPPTEERTEVEPVAPGSSPRAPLFVRTTQAGPEILRLMPTALGWLMLPLGTGGMVVLFAVFLLLNREDLRNRCIRLIGSDDLTGTTLALAEASDRIGRYLGMQVLINVASGATVALGLLLLGVPGWALWGFLYALLRFLPYIGPVLGVAMPTAAALATTPGFGLFFATLAVLLALELVVNLVLEPWLYGESSGISSFAVLVAAAFWTWLWGPVGLLLAMPLTVAMAVLGKHVRQFAFLHLLLGTDEAMSPTDRFYQRVIAGDPDEATTILAELAEDHSLVELHEALIVPALAAAERDRASGELSPTVYTTLCEIVRNASEDLELRYPMADASHEAAARATTDPASRVAPVSAPRCRVACLPVKGGATEVATAGLCRLLARAGHPSRTLSLDLTFAARLADVADDETLCLVALPDPSLRHLRATSTRLANLGSRRETVVLAWGGGTDPASAEDRALTQSTSAFVQDVADLLLAIARMQQQRTDGGAHADASSVAS